MKKQILKYSVLITLFFFFGSFAFSSTVYFSPRISFISSSLKMPLITASCTILAVQRPYWYHLIIFSFIIRPPEEYLSSLQYMQFELQFYLTEKEYFLHQFLQVFLLHAGDFLDVLYSRYTIFYTFGFLFRVHIRFYFRVHFRV